MFKRLERQTGIFIRSILSDDKFINYAKIILRYFPYFEENARMINYHLKKIGKNIAIDKSNFCKNKFPQKNRVIFFDISEIHFRNVGTGIQRVVSSLLFNLNKNGNKFLTVPIYANRNESFVCLEYNNGQKKFHGYQKRKIYINQYDLFFSADLNLNFPFNSLIHAKKYGLFIVFTIHDLFGLTLNRMLPDSYNRAFNDWFIGVLNTADAVVCISKSVSNELVCWLESHPGARKSSLPIGYFHLGANLSTVSFNPGDIHLEDNISKILSTEPTFLMVGTLESRKGHMIALKAFEFLWNKGVKLNLVIVGKEGWGSYELVRTLRDHTHLNKRLFWLRNAGDPLLIELYKKSSALLAASFAEGFGLPLIEAAYYGLPIIARDIPIFHEVAGEYAYYFPNTNSSDLAESIQHWLELDAEGKAPQSKGMPYLTWEQSTQQLLKVILEDNWYITYQPDEGLLEKHK